jgi:hypothetical protein
MTRLTIIRKLPRSAKTVRLVLTDDRAVATDVDTGGARGTYTWTGSALTGTGPLSDAQREFLTSQILDALVPA